MEGDEPLAASNGWTQVIDRYAYSAQFPAMGKRGNPNMRRGAPSVNPTGKRTRLDDIVNPYTGHGTANDSRIYTYHSTRPVTDREAMEMRRSNWLAKRICELKPSECFRRGYELKLEDKEQAEDVVAVAEGLCINKRLIEVGQLENTSGGGALFPVLDGALGDMSQPLDLDKSPRIAKVRAVHLLEPRELVPVSWYTDLNHPKFRQPMRYRLHPITGRGYQGNFGELIHESRLAIFPGARVTAEYQSGQLPGWGDSILTPVRSVIDDFGLSWGSASKILHAFSRRIVKLKDYMNTVAQKGGQETVLERVRTMDLLSSTLNTDVIDSEDTIENLVTSVAGLPEMLIQFAQLVCAASDYPMTRLFGMSPAGMNATGEFDQQGWIERIANEQAFRYTTPTEWLLRLIMLSTDGPTGGVEPDVWSIEWRPLKEQSEGEIATTRKTVAETDKIYYDMGLPAENLFTDRFGGDTYSMETTFDLAAFKAQQAEDEKIAEEMRAAEAEAAKVPAEGEKPTEADPKEPAE